MGEHPRLVLVTEVQRVEVELGPMHDEQHPGTPAGYSCPDCKGTLYELDDRDILRFRCRVGHAWSADALVTARDDEFGDALWTALRALEEQVSLTWRLAQRAERRDSGEVAERFRQQAHQAEARAATIRHVLLRSETDSAPDAALDGRGDGAGRRRSSAEDDAAGG